MTQSRVPAGAAFGRTRFARPEHQVRLAALACPSNGRGLTLPGERWLFDPSAFWAGIGDRAMLGELPNSMLKRQLRIPPGTAGSGLLNAVFYVIDQIDMLAGVWVVMYFFIDVTMVRVFRYIIFLFIVHQVFKVVGHSLGMRETSR